MKSRYEVQVQSKKGGKWQALDSYDIQSVAIEACSRTNRMFKFGESAHRVWDAKSEKEVYRRGICDIE